MRILVTGKNGQLGRSIHKLVTNTEQTDDFVFVGREELDLSNENNIFQFCIFIFRRQIRVSQLFRC